MSGRRRESGREDRHDGRVTGRRGGGRGRYVLLMRHPVILLLVLLAACAGGDVRVSDVYGAWRLDHVAGGATARDTAPPFLQFTPGGEVLFSGDGRRVERRRFSFRRGVPVAESTERFMLVIEGEPDDWIIERPNRTTLVIQPNNLESAPRTYRRER